MKKIGHNIMINVSDSKINPQNKNRWLSEGTLSMTWDNLFHTTDILINEDRLGRWSSIIIKGNRKTIEIITFYRIIESSTAGVINMHTQYNEILEKYYPTRYYRKQFLKDLSMLSSVLFMCMVYGL